MIVLLIGAPGVGKGTQAELLEKKFGLIKLSTGDVLRKQIKLGTKVGQQVEALMKEGQLVPDSILFEILKDELSKSSKAGILLDGYPRNLEQAEALQGLGDVNPVVAAIHIEVEESKLVSRLAGRRVCEDCGATYHIDNTPSVKANVCDKCNGDLVCRPDDRLEKIHVRLGVYKEKTEPVLNYYRQNRLYYEVDGEGTAEVVFSELEKLVKNILD